MKSEPARANHASARHHPPPDIPDHEILGFIGRGSYGDVWLARSHSGTLRAVKVVHAQDFDDHHPFEREFAGLKHFEPVSREHEGLVDILQLGRNEAEGWFYSIMELADEADGCAGNPESKIRNPNAGEPNSGRSSLGTPHTAYRPLTLEHRIRAEGRLPVAECVRIAATLADALWFLHERGLVHRDIKPSNIIFVGGVPKLADVGLVARAGSAFSFVGTEGFVAPEGPGSPKADLYSLGKCLYEMAMGKDRQAFPSPPTLLDELPDRSELLELNEVMTRACDPRPDQRYSSSATMAADLRILAAGQSLLQSRRRARLRRRALVAAAMACVVLLTGAGWFALRQPRLEILREFSLPGNWPAHAAKLGNFDGGSDLELFNAAGGSLSAVTLEGVALAERMQPEMRSDMFELQLVTDTDGDGRDEAFVSWHEGTNLHLSVFNQQFVETRRFDACGSLRSLPTGTSPDSSMMGAHFVPAMDGQPPALFTSVHTGYSLRPRGTLLFNFTNQAVLWSDPFPSMSWREVAVNTNGPARFVIGTQSHNNGARSPDGFDDAHSYLYAMSADGQRRWAVTTGPEFVSTVPRLLYHRGTNFVYATVWRHFELMLAAQDHSTNVWQPALLKFDLEGHELARFTTRQPLVELAFADLVGSGEPVALATTGDGSLLVLDTDLRLLRTVPVVPRTQDWVRLRVVAVRDLDGDSHSEVVLSASQWQFVSGNNLGHAEGKANVRRLHDNSVIVLDHTLRPLARRVIHPSGKHSGFDVLIAPLAAASGADILTLDQQVTVLRFRRR